MGDLQPLISLLQDMSSRLARVEAKIGTGGGGAAAAAPAAAAKPAAGTSPVVGIGGIERMNQ